MDKDLYKVLEELNINYKQVEHEKVYTVEAAEHIKELIDGIGCKNIFLKDKNNNYYLVVITDHKRVDTKYLEHLLKTKEMKFSSSEKLIDILNLEAGSVTPLGIINDPKNLVTLLIDKELVNKKLLVHPNRNDRTISIEYNDLITFIKYLNHNYLLF